MKIGAHIPVASGYRAAALYAEETGCECVQVFAKSPRQWKSRPLDPEAALVFRSDLASSGVDTLFTHTAYLINLGSADDTLWPRSIHALADELVRGHLLSADGVVTHVGTNAYGDASAATQRITSAVRAAYETAGVPTPLLLENTAGAGTTFGAAPAELGALARVLRDDGLPVAICLDTCHLHAWGVDLSTAAGWTDALDRLDDTVGSSAIRLVHANDCAYPAGSRRDRHAWVGQGTIGLGGFAAMFEEPRLHHTAVVIEMPGEPPEKDSANIAALKRLRAEASAGRSQETPTRR